MVEVGEVEHLQVGPRRPELAELPQPVDDLGGTPAEVVDKLGRYAEAGSTRAYLQVLDLADLDHLDLVASEVMPQL